MRMFQLMVIAAYGAWQTYALAVRGEPMAAALLGVVLPAGGIVYAELVKAGDLIATLVLPRRSGSRSWSVCRDRGLPSWVPRSNWGVRR